MNNRMSTATGCLVDLAVIGSAFLGLCSIVGCGGNTTAPESATIVLPAPRDFAADLAAAQNGNISGMIRVAEDYIHGTGTKVDYGQAMQWLQRASGLGSNEASALVGSMYFYGYGVPRDTAQVLSIETPLAAKGLPAAYMSLARAWTKTCR